MARLFVVEGGKAQVLEKQEFQNEGLLQNILEKFPEFVALDDLGVSEPFVVIGREVATPAGYIDVLCIDGDGVLTVIETKLARNPQIRREVVGQILEYVAQVSKWRADDVVRVAHQYFQSASVVKEYSGATLFDVYKEISEQGPEMLSPEDLYEKIDNNLRSGRIKVVIASDTIPDILKDTVNFINSFSNFDIFVLQIQSFKRDNLEIYAPIIFGLSRKIDAGVSLKRGRWDEETFFNAIASFNNDTIRVVKEIYEFCRQHAYGIRWGTGIVQGSFSFIAQANMRKFTVFTVWTSSDLTINFGNMKGIIEENALHIFRKELNRLPNVNLTEEVVSEGKYPTISIDALKKPEYLKIFKTAVETLLEA